MANSPLSLWSLKVGETGVVTSSVADEKLRHRLTELGFAQGCQVKCVDRLPFSGPRCYLTSRGEFALDQEIAKSIGVRS